MAQPIILNAGNDNSINDSTYYAGFQGVSRASDTINNVTIPVEANTAVFIAALDNSTTSSTIVTDITVGLLTPIFEFDTKEMGGSYQQCQIKVYDVSGLEAQNLSVTVDYTAATTEGSMLGVLCTDGYLLGASETLKIGGYTHLYEKQVVLDADNTTMAYLGVSDALTGASLTPSNGTVVEFKSTGSNGFDPAISCCSQKNFSAGTGVIDATYAAAQDRSGYVFQFHSKSDPIGGKKPLRRRGYVTYRG